LLGACGNILFYAFSIGSIVFKLIFICLKTEIARSKANELIVNPWLALPAYVLVLLSSIWWVYLSIQLRRLNKKIQAKILAILQKHAE
jgi:hypothetical protein